MLSDIVNKSSVSFFLLLLKYLKKNSGVVDMQKQARSTTVLEEILPDLHHHITRFA